MQASVYLRMYNVFICVKANKKHTNEKINPLDYINMNNFYLLNKLIKLKVKWRNGKYLHHFENGEVVLKHKKPKLMRQIFNTECKQLLNQTNDRN